MSRILDYSAAAKVDLARIWEHHAEQVSIRGADLMIHGIEETLRRVIARHPSSGRVRPELGQGIRSFPVLPYVVFYRIEPRRIRIERVLHGHRDIRQPLTSLFVA